MEGFFEYVWDVNTKTLRINARINIKGTVILIQSKMGTGICMEVLILVELLVGRNLRDHP